MLRPCEPALLRGLLPCCHAMNENCIDHTNGWLCHFSSHCSDNNNGWLRHFPISVSNHTNGRLRRFPISCSGIVPCVRRHGGLFFFARQKCGRPMLVQNQNSMCAVCLSRIHMVVRNYVWYCREKVKLALFFSPYLGQNGQNKQRKIRIFYLALSLIELITYYKKNIK